MKFFTLSLLIGAAMFHLVGYGQEKTYKFGIVNPEEFNIKPQGIDSGAAAIKIFDIGRCRFQIMDGQYVYIFERHFRYRILHKNGYDYANHNVALINGKNRDKEELYSFDAATYNMQDDKITVSKITKDAKFTEDFSSRYAIKKFALPNVKEGSIIEYRYAIKSAFIWNLRGWSFQTDVPVLYTEYNITIPNFFLYKINATGMLQIKQTKNERIRDVLSAGYATYQQYTMSNVPALREEEYIANLDDYRTKIDFELTASQMPGYEYRDYTGSWPKIVNSLIKDVDFGSFIKDNVYTQTILPKIVKDEVDTLKMVKLIYEHVKHNFKWNGYYNFYASADDVKTAFEKKTGNSADINLCLINLLKEANLKASPVLVSTRENGAHPGYPILSRFNNVIGSVCINNKDILLDATNKDLPFGMIAYQNLNQQALKIDLDSVNAGWISSVPNVAAERIFSYTLTLDKQNRLSGILNQYAKGYSALKIRNAYKEANNQDEFLKAFKKDKVGLELSKYTIANLDQPDEILTEMMDVVIEDHVEEAGNLVYFTPLLFQRQRDNPFKQERRDFPVDFAHPVKESYRILINFPDDYEIEKLPESSLYKIPNNTGTFSISFLTSGKTIQVKSVVDISKPFYSANEYFDLKELFKAIVLKQAEQIVFKKRA